MKVLSGQEEINSGASIYLINLFFDMSIPVLHTDVLFMSRASRTVTAWGNISSPFDNITWIVIVILLIVFSLLFLLSHRIYAGLGCKVKHEHSRFNFFMFTFCKVTEPEPLPWFKTGHGGKLLVFTWTIMACLLIIFYQSTLRAHLMTLQYEKPISSLQDVVDNNRRVWIARGFLPLTWVHIHLSIYLEGNNILFHIAKKLWRQRDLRYK